MANTPDIRFKGFSEDWEERKFGDVGFVSMCKRIFKEETFDEGDIPFYKIGTFGSKPDAYISRKLFEEYKAKFSFPEQGDILLSASGTIGRIVEYRGEEAYFQDSNIVWLSHDKSISNKFLKVLYPIVRWDGIEGSTIQRLYNDNFLKTKFMMPKIEEQERLGEYFGQIDNLITFHQRKYDEMSELKKYMLQKMFPKKGEQFPEIRFSGFTEPWKEHRLLKILAQPITDGPHETPELVENGVPFISVDAIVDNKIDFNRKRGDITEEYDIECCKKYKPELYDVYLVKSGSTVGKVAIVETTERFNIWSPLAAMRCIGKSNPYFLYYLLQTKDFQSQVMDKASNGTQPNLSMRELERFPIKAPISLDEQFKISEYLRKLDHLITLHQSKCDELKQLKKYMLQNMFPKKG